MRVVITSLAMRFHEHDGWTKEILDRYLSHGSFRERHYGDLIGKPDGKYWILEVGASLDVDRMFLDGVVDAVVGGADYGETRTLSGPDAMKTRNW